MGYTIRITTRAVEVVSGADSTPGIVAAEASGVKVGLRAKWGGSDLCARTGKVVRQGNGWTMEGIDSPYSGNTPSASSNGFSTSSITSPFGPPTPASVPLLNTPGTCMGPPPTPFLSGGLNPSRMTPGPPPRDDDRDNDDQPSLNWDILNTSDANGRAIGPVWTHTWLLNKSDESSLLRQGPACLPAPLISTTIGADVHACPAQAAFDS